MGRESFLRMTINDFNKLKDNIQKHNFVDASSLIWELRMIKTKNEISKMKKIISIASKAFDELPNLIKIGQSEIEITNIMKKKLLDLGADHTLYMSCASGEGGYDQIICNPTEKKPSEGDILMIDTVATFDGYFCDFDRNFAFERANDLVQRAYATVYAATDAGLATAKPGATTSEIWLAMWRIMEKGGARGNSIGRLGHGLGMQLTEWPSNTEKDGTPLETGVVLTLEPSMEFAPGKQMVHEENILITEDGAELLSRRAPAELPVIG